MSDLAPQRPAASSDTVRTGSSTAGSCGSSRSVERNGAVCIKRDRPNHLGPAAKGRKIFAPALARINGVCEQCQRFKSRAGTVLSSTKFSQELNETFARVGFENADILPAFPLLRYEPLPLVS